MIRTPRLVANRYGVFSVRLLIPAAQTGTGRRKEIRHSLGTKNPDLARVLALQFNLHFEQARMATDKPSFHEIAKLITPPYRLDIQKGIMESDNAADHKRMMEAVEAYRLVQATNPPLAAMAHAPAETATPAPAAKRTVTFSTAYEFYLNEKRHDNEPKTLDEKRGTYKEFIALFGDLMIGDIDKAQMRKWKAFEDGKATFTARRINKRLSFFSDFFNWASNNGHYPLSANPCDGLRISTKGKLAEKTKSYLPFSDGDISKIFGAGYLAFMDKPHHYWIPILGLYTGRRIEPLASLTVSQVRDMDGVLSLAITKDKNKASQGTIPIHPKLLELGFREYVQGIKDAGHTHLFPILKAGKNGYSKNTSRRFGEWLDKVGVSDPQKVFHSLRHSVITRLHAKRGNPAHVMQLVGHSEGRSVHYGTYTHTIEPVELLETLKLLEYPTFNIQSKPNQ